MTKAHIPMLKRKYRFVVAVLLGVVVISCTVRAVVQSQLNKEIKYFKTYFEQKKDGLDALYNPLAIKQIPEETIDFLYKTRLAAAEKKNGQAIDWSQYAYVNYATDANYLCNTLIMFESLRKLGSKAQLLLLLSKHLVEAETSPDYQQVKKMVSQLEEAGKGQVVIKYIDSIHKPSDTTQWSQSMTKLLVFNQTEYERVIFLDNDAILNDNLDELFFLPDYIKFAAPVSYWYLSEKDLDEACLEVKNVEKLPNNLARYTDKLEDRIRRKKLIYNYLPSLPPTLYLDSKNVAKDLIRAQFSLASLFDHHISEKSGKIKFASNVMVIKPSKEMFESIEASLPKNLRKAGKYDGDVINDEIFNLRKILHTQFKFFRRIRSHFVPSVMVLPYARYGLLSGSIRDNAQHSILRNDILGTQRLDTSGNEIPRDISALTKNAKYIHFSDHPLGKPWQYRSVDDIKCIVDEKKSKDLQTEEQICRLWNNLYGSYLNDRGLCSA